MCNLAGWVGSIDRKHVESLLLQSCGTFNDDATGVALHLGSKISILKAPMSASQFIDGRWRKWYGEKASKVLGGLIHTRLATNGSPKDNRNNHPHVSLQGSILVHKGIIQSETHYEAKSACDSEQLLHALDAKGLKEGVASCSGWASIAYISSKDPHKIWLYSSSGNIDLYVNNGYTLFATSILVGFGKPLIHLTAGQWIGISLSDRRFTWGPETKLLQPIVPTYFSYFNNSGQNWNWYH